MKILEGIITSAKNKKTVVVKIERKVAHSKYNKLIKRDQKFQAHTEKELKVGDKVTIRECKRVSKNKYFEVI